MSRLYKEIKHPLFSNGEIPELSLFPSGGIIYELAHSTSSSTRMKQQKRILVPLDTTIWSSFFFRDYVDICTVYASVSSSVPLRLKKSHTVYSLLKSIYQQNISDLPIADTYFKFQEAFFSQYH